MKTRPLALALAILALASAPPAAAAADLLCEDRECLVSLEWRECVTHPCDVVTVCLAREAVCVERLLA